MTESHQPRVRALAADVTALISEFPEDATCDDPFGVWYHLSFVAAARPPTEVILPADVCRAAIQAPPPTVCKDLAAALAIATDAVRPIPCPSLSPCVERLLVTSVDISRTPGLLILPPADRFIPDLFVSTRLARDVRSLPPQPDGFSSCPISYGTSYTLRFTPPGSPPWAAAIAVGGCSEVRLSNGVTLFAYWGDALYRDLGSALGLTRDEVQPHPCGRASPPPGTHCYAQPSARA